MVPGTRISLDVLVADFKQGKTPESVHDACETVSLVLHHNVPRSRVDDTT